MDTDATPSGVRPDSLTEGAARLIIGAAALGMDGLSWLLRKERRANHESTSSPEGPLPLSNAAVGLAVRSVSSSLAMGLRGIEVAGRGLRTAADTTSRAIDRTVPAFVKEPLERTRDRAAGRIRDLGTPGRSELDEARRLARRAFDETLDALMARLADSRELQMVIRTQTVSATEETVDDIRHRAAGLDDRLEGVARRLVHRKTKPVDTPP